MSAELRSIPAQWLTSHLIESLEAEAPALADDIIEEEIRDMDAVELLMNFAKLYHLAQVDPHQAANKIGDAYFGGATAFSQSIVLAYEVRDF